MKNICKRRDNFYTEALYGLNRPTPQKITLLFHHIYSLKLGDEYLINSEEELKTLVDFLNTDDYWHEIIENDMDDDLS